MALNESVCFTYRDLVHLMRAVSDAKDGQLTSDSANRISAAFRSLACTNPAEAEVRFHLAFHLLERVHLAYSSCVAPEMLAMIRASQFRSLL